MPHLMAEMTQQGAIRFAQPLSHLFTRGIVGLDQRDGDDTIGVPGQHAL